MNDIRYAIRWLSKAPAFTAVAVVTLGLGIGANTAIFSVVQGVLLRSLPFDSPDRIVQIQSYDSREGMGRGTISYADFLDWRAQAASLEAVAAYDEWTPTVDGADGPTRVIGASVSAPYFAILGAHPGLGRFFTPDEDPPGTTRAVVLSHSFWVTHFAADPAVVGRSARFTGIPYTVVGVAPAAFEDPRLSGLKESPPAVWRVSPTYFGNDATNRGGRAYTAIARLKPGVALERATEEMNVLASRLARQYPETNAYRAARLVPITEYLVGGVRSGLVMVFAGAMLVLLVACINTANLLLSRASARRREMGVRTALGASRGRLVRQLLLESLVLGGLGAILGVALAYYAVGALQTLGGSELPRIEQVGVNAPVLMFAIGATALTVLLFGLAPVAYSLRTDVRSALTPGATGAPGPHGLGHHRAVLVASEVALALVVLASAGLLGRSLWGLRHVPLGFEPAGVLTVQVDFPPNQYANSAALTLGATRLINALSGLRGVTAAGATSILPMSGDFNGMVFSIAGRPEPPPGEGAEAETHVVTPGYFVALGIPVIRGRGFDETDRTSAPPVVLISELTAAKYWPGQDPLGARISLQGETREVVGIVGDTRQLTLAEEPEPALYMPEPQTPAWMRSTTVLAVRTAPGSSLSLAVPEVRMAIRGVDPTLVISNVRPLASVVSSTAAASRFYAVLVGLFGLLALGLGAVGVYGVVSYGVAQRTREFGIRAAVGAPRRELVSLVVRQGMVPVVAGAVPGLAGALIAGRAIAGQLFGVSPSDVPTLVVVLLVLATTGAIASYLPARRAARVDPTEALRYE